MANTSALSEIVEPFVRKWLKQKYGEKFENKNVALTLTTGGKHKFDAVSVDRSIVADVKSSSARNDNASSRKFVAGTFRSAIVDVDYLSLIIAKKKILVLTNRDFFDYFIKRMKGKIASGIEVLYCQLPLSIRKKTGAVLLNAQREIGKKR